MILFVLYVAGAAVMTAAGVMTLLAGGISAASFVQAAFFFVGAVAMIGFAQLVEATFRTAAATEGILDQLCRAASNAAPGRRCPVCHTGNAISATKCAQCGNTLPLA